MPRGKPGTSQRTAVNIDLSGPFFQKDVDKTIFENIHKMMIGIAQEGEAAAREGLMSGAGSRKLIRELDDRVADHVVGRTYARSGKRWVAAAVVQVYNFGFSAIEGRSLMAAASYVERRTAAIRRVTRQLNSAKAVLRANLTEGIE